ncbi:uncharacterized protein LOC114593548 isoform X2 [Podarcis muralis]
MLGRAQPRNEPRHFPSEHVSFSGAQGRTLAQLQPALGYSTQGSAGTSRKRKTKSPRRRARPGRPGGRGVRDWAALEQLYQSLTVLGCCKDLLLCLSLKEKACGDEDVALPCQNAPPQAKAICWPSSGSSTCQMGRC